MIEFWVKDCAVLIKRYLHYGTFIKKIGFLVWNSGTQFRMNVKTLQFYKYTQQNKTSFSE